MVSKYWYDKIAASAAEAEQVLADAAGEENENSTAEEAADEAQGAEDIDEAASREGTVDEARLQEDIMIAQEVAATDLPTDVKVEIMEDQGVDPSIIDEVIDADTTDAVAAYYGVDPYWLHDKRAAVSMAGAKALGKKALDAARSYGRKGLDATKTYGKKGIDAAKGAYSKMSPNEKRVAAGLAAGGALGGAYALGKRSDKESSLDYLPSYLADKTAGLKAKQEDRNRARLNNTVKAIQDAYQGFINPGAQRNAAIGAGIGGLAGAGLGYLADGGRGALIGGLGGAGLGGLAGYNYQDLADRLYGKTY